jgi:hypothetical protein
MSTAYVSFLIDDITERSLVDKRSEILRSVDEKIVIPLPAELNKEERSRWLKTTMRHHIVDDFLYIDCDTIVVEDLSCIFNLDADLAAVLDKHSLLENHPSRERIRIRNKKMGFSSSYLTDKYFNSGLIFCRDKKICHDFFSEWHKLWLICISKNMAKDQSSLNQTNLLFNNIIAELDGIWNCQIEDGGIQFLVKSKIIHYFFSNAMREKPYLLSNSFVFQEIKKEGRIPPDIKNMLSNAKSLFHPNTSLIADKRVLNIINSSLSDFLIKKTFDKENKSLLINLLSNFITGSRNIKRSIVKLK